MKVIETFYAGYRFRSRLEARWAVFFDTLGISYRYEFEGYDLDGVWYLPDFYLPDLDCFVEIKGQSLTSDERRKTFLLALSTGKPVYTFAGDIWLPQEPGGYTGYGDIPPRCVAKDNLTDNKPVYLSIPTSPALVEAIKHLSVSNRVSLSYWWSDEKPELGIHTSAFSDLAGSASKNLARQIAQIKIQQQALEALVPLLEDLGTQLQEVLRKKEKDYAHFIYDLLPYCHLENVAWMELATTKSIVPGVLAQSKSGSGARPIDIQSWWMTSIFFYNRSLQSNRLIEAYTAARQARFEGKGDERSPLSLAEPLLPSESRLSLALKWRSLPPLQEELKTDPNE